jgi:UDP:flavonoid glycosyltransferase YjiC (YdhE family)
MRIALAAEGTRGDVHPLIALGASLRAGGHDVVLCSPPDFRDAALAAGLEHRIVGRPVRAYLTDRAHVLHGGALGVLRETESYGRRILESQFAALPDAVRGAELVLAAGVQVAAHSAAELCGARYRYVAYCPAILPSAEHPPAFLPISGSPRGNRIVWSLLRFGLHATVRRSLNGYRRALGLAPVDDLFAHLVGPGLLLAADRALAPAPADLRFSCTQIPCLHEFDASEPLPAKLEHFLGSGPPPVYIGFGSMTDPDPLATTAQLVESVTAAGHRALLAAGWAGLGTGPLPDGVLAIGVVPHASLFPRCAAVVHHGGAGTTTMAARAGVPQILVPHVLDQFYWAGRVTALGIGAVAGRRRGLGTRALAEAIAAVAGNELVEERARTLADRIHEERRDDTLMRHFGTESRRDA